MSFTVTRTYLTLPTLAALVPGRGEVAARLVHIAPCPVDQWRALYRQIGAAWHWHDRDLWDQGRMQTHLDRADVRIYQMVDDTAPAATDPIGFLELERHHDGSVEIAYLGLDHRAFGRGLGAWLVTEAARTAFAWGATRVWLHTCTLDSPAALPNYLARGFSIEKTETYEATLSS
ncbi:GNAT family N-acetyltransferase [Gemmatimonas sp.]|uniref:GNAT family N-acetyltransferase n=1 Tax=Gemmatimonas sp. TaxID=1962908 RepID=UPI00333FBCEA